MFEDNKCIYCGRTEKDGRNVCESCLSDIQTLNEIYILEEE